MKNIAWGLAIALLVIVACSVGLGVWAAVWSFYFLFRFAIIGVLFIVALYLVFRIVRNMR